MSKMISFGLRGFQVDLSPHLPQVFLLIPAFQFFWTLLIIALVGNMIANATGGNPSIVNYCMFVAVFSMLSLVYLVASTLNESFAIMSFGPLLVDGLNALFFFIGGVALAAYLGVHSCGNGVGLPLT